MIERVEAARLASPVAGGGAVTRADVGETVAPIPQYSARQVLLVWAAAALPMGFLGWVVAPALARNGQPGLERQAVLTVGLVWQCLLVLLLVYREAGNLRWSTVRHRLWLTAPRSPRTGEPNRRLWWWLLPFSLLTALFQLRLGRLIDHLWGALVPSLRMPVGFDFVAALGTPDNKASLVGAWPLWVLFVVSALFNTVLGEELLFRGLLLPRMAGAFGRWDWLMNGLLFGLYHLHQPWGILKSAVEGALFLAFPSRRFRSAWFGIAAHSGQSVYLALLLLGLVLGLG